MNTRSGSVVAGDVERALIELVDDENRTGSKHEPATRANDTVLPAVGFSSEVLQARDVLRDEHVVGE